MKAFLITLHEDGRDDVSMLDLYKGRFDDDLKKLYTLLKNKKLQGLAMHVTIKQVGMVEIHADNTNSAAVNALLQAFVADTEMVVHDVEELYIRQLEDQKRAADAYEREMRRQQAQQTPQSNIIV